MPRVARLAGAASLALGLRQTLAQSAVRPRELPVGSAPFELVERPVDEAVGGDARLLRHVDDSLEDPVSVTTLAHVHLLVV